jgi:hypothetical protein
MLVFAIPTGLPYGYYILLRWIICASSAYIAYLAAEQEKKLLIYIYGALAIVFNPIFQLYLGKDIWVIVDGVAILLFIISLFTIKPAKK